MVAIVGLVVCQEEEFPFLFKERLPIGRESGNVGRHGIHGSHCAMFRALNKLKTKAFSRIKELICTFVFETI